MRLSLPMHGCLLLAALFGQAKAAEIQADAKPFARKHQDRILLIEDKLCYAINMRLEVDGRYLYYVTQFKRDEPSVPRKYSDMPSPLILDGEENISALWVLDNRIYALAPPPDPVAPPGHYPFSLSHYPFFDGKRRMRGLAPTKGKDERGEIVQRTPEKEKELNQKIADAMKRGDSPEKLYGGSTRTLFHDVKIYGISD